MSKFGPKFSPNDAPALPHWIGGRAYLTMAPAFLDVQAADGRVLRRVPLCGEAEADAAVRSAGESSAAWQALDGVALATAWQTVHDLAARFRDHLAKVFAEESGANLERVDAELAGVLAALAVPVDQPAAAAGGVVAVIADAGAPLAEPLACAVAALRAGRAVVLKPSVRVPSPLFALAEVFTRAGFPAGRVNVLQGDEAAVRALCAHPGVEAVACSGDGVVARVVREVAAASGKPAVAGSGEALAAAWRAQLAR